MKRGKEAMKLKNSIIPKVEKCVAALAIHAASLGANTACPCVGYQPKETKAVKKLRKF